MPRSISIFIEHLQKIAQAHFDVSRRERRYGEKAVEPACS